MHLHDQTNLLAGEEEGWKEDRQSKWKQSKTDSVLEEDKGGE